MELIGLIFNPILAIVPILPPLKTTGNLCLSGVFSGIKCKQSPDIGYCKIW